MKKYEIKISYSWGDEEEPIVIEKKSKKDAFDWMLELATKKAEICMKAYPNAKFVTKIHPAENKIILCYGCDNKECYYELIDMD